MSKKQVRFEGQLPLISQVEGGTKQDEIEEPMTFNSPVESSFFEQSMLKVVPEDRRNDVVKRSISSIYSAYYAYDNAQRVLASAVFNFCELTGCEYGVVSTALSNGLQKQLDKSWISKLYHAGKVMALNPVASKITDIEKLALVGRLEPSEIRTAITENSGRAMIGDKFVSLMKRDEFRDSLATISPDKFPEPKAKEWNLKAYRDATEAAIQANSQDIQLTTVLKSALAILDVKIKASEDAKLAHRQAQKIARAESKLNEMRATA